MRVVEPLLGTRAEIAAAGDDVEAAAAAESAVIDEVRRLEAVFSVFDDSSAVRHLRETGSTSIVELLKVIELADTWRDRTAGAFDADLGGLIALWNDAEVRERVPSDVELAAAIEQRDQDRSTRSNINLNAIAKGWIIGAALDSVFANQDALNSAWVNAGGDIVHRGAQPLVVGIENPARPYDNVAPLARVELSNESLATSGGSRRWWTIGGERFSRVLDPRTGRPAAQVASATMIASHPAAADALATAAIVLSPEETMAMVASAGAACLLVHLDGATSISSQRFELA